MVYIQKTWEGALCLYCFIVTIQVQVRVQSPKSKSKVQVKSPNLKAKVKVKGLWQSRVQLCSFFQLLVFLQLCGQIKQLVVVLTIWWLSGGDSVSRVLIHPGQVFLNLKNVGSTQRSTRQHETIRQSAVVFFNLIFFLGEYDESISLVTLFKLTIKQGQMINFKNESRK